MKGQGSIPSISFTVSVSGTRMQNKEANMVLKNTPEESPLDQILTSPG